jgi:hypothetical protein
MIEAIKKIRDLASDYLDIELRLANTNLSAEVREVLDIEQERIIDKLRKGFDEY